MNEQRKKRRKKEKIVCWRAFRFYYKNNIWYLDYEFTTGAP